MEDIEFVYTVGMSNEELLGYIEATETGVLSLADGSRAYGVPLGFHYEDGRFFFRVGDDDGAPEKIDFLEATTEATFLLYSQPRHDASWSVMARGPIEPVSETFDPAVINEQYPELRVFDEDIDSIQLRYYVLDPRSITGRRTPEIED